MKFLFQILTFIFVFFCVIVLTNMMVAKIWSAIGRCVSEAEVLIQEKRVNIIKSDESLFSTNDPMVLIPDDHCQDPPKVLIMP